MKYFLGILILSTSIQSFAKDFLCKFSQLDANNETVHSSLFGLGHVYVSLIYPKPIWDDLTNISQAGTAFGSNYSFASNENGKLTMKIGDFGIIVDSQSRADVEATFPLNSYQKVFSIKDESKGLKLTCRKMTSADFKKVR